MTWTSIVGRYDKALFNSNMSKSQLYGRGCRHLKFIGVRSKRFLVVSNAGLYESELDTLTNVWPITLATSKGDEYKAVDVSNIGIEAFHHGLHSFREEFHVLGIAASAAFRIASVTLKTASSTALFWTIVPVIIANRVN
ncbi:hypothetical protein TNCV_4226571 [Trichonephila clavipes]|nr:hypothetical protein TNCV_4226571 [Trichonephila clavipes]